LRKEYQQTGVWPNKYGLSPFLKKRRSVCANLFYQKRFSTAISALVKTWPTKTRNSETLWPCSTTKGSWSNQKLLNLDWLSIRSRKTWDAREKAPFCKM